MSRIIDIFLKNGGFITFAVFEAICFFMIVNYNEKQNSIYAYSTELFAGKALNQRQKVTRYVRLAETNDSLAAENARLHAQLLNRQMISVPVKDTMVERYIDSVQGTVVIPKYTYISGKAISNTTFSQNNYLYINRGKNHGVRAGMGVVVNDGIVGIVRHVGDDLSVAMSILHRQSRISVRLKKENTLGSLFYEGTNPEYMSMGDVPKHVNVAFGDTIVTSGYSSIFPPNIVVGYIDDVKLPGGDNFYRLRVRLSHDMSKTDHVYLVDNMLQHKIDTLKAQVEDER